MVEFKHYPAIGKQGEKIKLTMASGPVIIENNKILLVKHEDPFWKFPGGKQLDTNNFQENAIREAKEELGINITLEGDPLIMAFERYYDGVKEYVILVHYLAKRQGKIKLGKGIAEFAWLDINHLPEDCAPNIKPVLEYFRK